MPQPMQWSSKILRWRTSWLPVPICPHYLRMPTDYGESLTPEFTNGGLSPEHTLIYGPKVRPNT